MLIAVLCFGCQPKGNTLTNKQNSKETLTRPQTPLMGWASWNNFRININEDIIKAQTDALVATGMKAAGYNYVNIDDGFFGGRDSDGNLLVHKTRFPNGMKSLASYIHQKGLKAGIYSDAGINTCASYWDKDTIGAGMGLYGHEKQDLTLFLKDWKYDFIKVDWCGGAWLDLDEKTQYTKIGKIIRELRPDVVYNICRWQFPGEWVVGVADSWRISADIANNFESVLSIIDKNADLWKYSGPGHLNDMDMLQVGRGMTLEEDKSHFSMWCMLSAPLIAGNNLTTISKETLGVITNKELIAINQDSLVYQARRIINNNNFEIWAKPLAHTMSGEIAIALLNKSEKTETIALNLSDVGIDVLQGYQLRDIWANKNYPSSKERIRSFEVSSHGTIVLKASGTSLPYNIFQFHKKKPF